jgi:hypothetical protein
MERACMAAVGLVPISFDTPAAHIGCAGKMRMAKAQPLPLCTICARFGNAGEQVEPAARIVGGAAECVNFAAHAMDCAREVEAASPCALGGMA